MEKKKSCLCAECGKPLKADEKFCPNCGSARRRVSIAMKDTVEAFSEIIEEGNEQLGKIKGEGPPKRRRSRA